VENGNDTNTTKSMSTSSSYQP